ncbi:MAG: glutaredoxin family protein [Planctomycetes bacterium]|nr:glutaredoxin family protein [Planctomycetota bacterium]
MSPPQVVLYTRQDCHLCDEAKVILLRFGLRFEEVDIDQDPVLVEHYNDCVPVVVIDGKQRFMGRVDEVLLRRLLRGKS